MKDHRFPARRNSLTQASFTYQAPAGWRSPRGFFLPCRKCELPWFSRPHCHTCPVSPESLALLMMESRIPAPYAVPFFPCLCSGVLQAPSRHHKSKQRRHSLWNCSRPGRKGAGTPAGLSWWRGWSSRQRPCKGKRSQGKKRRSKKAGRAGYCSSGQQPLGHLRVEPAVVSPLWGLGVAAQLGPAPAAGRLGTRSRDSGSSGCTVGAPELGERKPARLGTAAHPPCAPRAPRTHQWLRREGRGAGVAETG